MRAIKQLQLAVNKRVYRTAKKVQKPQQKYYFEQKEMQSPYEKQPCQEKTVKKLKKSLQLQPKTNKLAELLEENKQKKVKNQTSMY